MPSSEMIERSPAEISENIMWYVALNHKIRRKDGKRLAINELAAKRVFKADDAIGGRST